MESLLSPHECIRNSSTHPPSLLGRRLRFGIIGARPCSSVLSRRRGPPASTSSLSGSMSLLQVSLVHDIYRAYALDDTILDNALYFRRYSGSYVFRWCLSIDCYTSSVASFNWVWFLSVNKGSDIVSMT